MVAKGAESKGKSAHTAVKVYLFPAESQDAWQGQLRQLAQEIAANLSQMEPSQGKELLGTFVSDLFVAVASQDIQENRRQKQAEGIAAAKARGVRFGPEPKPLPDNFDECYKAWQSGQVTATQAAEACGLSRKGFYRAIERKKKMTG